MEVIRKINKLDVTYHNRLVGTLMLTPENETAVFRYDRQWLSDGFSISPRELPLKEGLFIAPTNPFYGNFGIFEDSLPDGYGRYLLNRMLRAHGLDDTSLTPLQRLSIIGSAGMGALCYSPASELVSSIPLLQLDDIQAMALDVLSEKTDDGVEMLYFNSGNSGGCRPKCLLHSEGKDWLIKFRHTYDPADIGLIEYKYMLLAQKCGIEIPLCKLFEGKYFASQRFDIRQDGTRLHVATVRALLSVGLQPPALDYRDLLSLTGWLTQSPEQVEQMYRRMVFNVLIGNKDDHAKNFSFIYDSGCWRLSPAYDLLPFPEGYHGQHATSVMYNGNPTDEDLLAVGETIRINRKRGKHIIDEIKEILHTNLR